MAITKVSRGLLSTGISDSSNATAITIDSSENVGIGTSSPSAPLTVSTTGSGDAVIIESTEAGSSNAPDLVLHRNSASPADNDSLGIIRFRGENDASEAIDLINIFGQVTDVSDGSEDSTLYFKTYTDGAEQSPLTLVGANVGIGNASPTTNLHIGSGTAGNALGVLLNRGATTNFFEANDGTKSAYIGTDNSQNFIKLGSLSNHAVQISQNNAAAITIDTSKNVGIGTTSPADILHLVSAAPILKVEATNDSSGFRIDCLGQSSGQAFRILKDTLTTLFTVDISGNVTAAGSISDERLKENISLIDNPLDKIKELKGITYKLKESGYIGTGLIAQDLQKVLPEAVYEVNEPEKNDESHLAINYGNTVGLLVESIKEQQTQIEALQSEINTLKGGD